MKECTLQGLGEIITPHVLSRTVHNPQVALINLVMNKEKTNVQSASALARAALTLLGKDDSGLVVLVKDIILHINPLGFKEQLGPKHWTHHIVGANQFCIST